MLRRLAVRGRLRGWRRSRSYRRSRMRRKFLVHHRSGGLAGMEVLLLLRLQRAPRMLLHCRCFLNIRQFFRRWWSFRYQRRPIGWWRTATVHFGLVGGRRSMRDVGRSRSLVSGGRGRRRVRAVDLCIVPGRRLRRIVLIRNRSLRNILIRSHSFIRSHRPIRPHGFIRPHRLIRPHGHRRNGSGCHCGLSWPVRHWRVLHDRGSFGSYRGTSRISSRRYSFGRRVDFWMRDHLRPRDLLWVDLHQIARHRLGVAKRVRQTAVVATV